MRTSLLIHFIQAAQKIKETPEYKAKQEKRAKIDNVRPSQVIVFVRNEYR